MYLKLFVISILLSVSSFGSGWELKAAPDIIVNGGVIIPQSQQIKEDLGKSDKAGVSIGVLANFILSAKKKC